MIEPLAFITITLDMVMFLLTVFMHTMRKNEILVSLYLLQSLALSIFLTATSFEGNLLSGIPENFDLFLFFAAGLTLIVKVIFAPALFFRLTKRYRYYFSSDTYLDTPWTLVSALVISFFSYFLMSLHLPSANFASVSPILGYSPLHLAGILLSLLLIVNRKDALSQILGILALENWIVFIAALSGLRHTFGLELAITFDILVWIIIALAFIAMVERHFGSMNVSGMTHLKEEDD